MLAAVLTLTIYLAANPGPRDDARKFLTATVIAGLRQVDPFLVGGKIWAETLDCPPRFAPASRWPSSSTLCGTLLGQVIRLPGALVRTARYVAGTGWPGITVGVLTTVFLVPMVFGTGNPLVWPIAVLLGSLLAGIFLWVMQWLLVGMAATLAGVLWLIAAVAGWLLAGEWVFRGLEIRRAIAGEAHGSTAPRTKAIRPEGARPAGR